MNTKFIRKLIHDNPRTFEGYLPSVREAVGHYAQRRRDDGIQWNALESEVGISSTSMRLWMRAVQVGGFHEVVVVDDHSPSEVVDRCLVITSPSGFMLTGCTLDQAAAVLQSLR